MSCDTCNSTLQNVNGAPTGRRVFWCPRCGTLVSETGEHRDVEAPRWTRQMVDAKWHETYAEFMHAMQSVAADLQEAREESA